ncbi:hypothetical protein V2J56_03425 [Georgenia sp. MJ206]|uniref:hypothetical protein n=1 Tax=Georgenia wangjunii TaxID=3117730 RepID=UPI002F26CDD6
MREVLAILAGVAAADDAARAQRTARLAEFRSTAEERRVRLAAKLAAGESFIAQLDAAR